MSDQAFLNFARIETKNRRSVWKLERFPFEEGKAGMACFTGTLTSGASKGKLDRKRDWNEKHGCPDMFACNIQFIAVGHLEVEVGNEVKHFGPGQADGQVVCFSDILDPQDFANGHRTRVIEDVIAFQVQLNRAPGGD